MLTLLLPPPFGFNWFGFWGSELWDFVNQSSWLEWAARVENHLSGVPGQLYDSLKASLRIMTAPLRAKQKNPFSLIWCQRPCSPIPHFMHKLSIQEMVQLLRKRRPEFSRSLNLPHLSAGAQYGTQTSCSSDSRTESPQSPGKLFNLSGLRVFSCKIKCLAH